MTDAQRQEVLNALALVSDYELGRLGFMAIHSIGARSDGIVEAMALFCDRVAENSRREYESFPDGVSKKNELSYARHARELRQILADRRRPVVRP